MGGRIRGVLEGLRAGCAELAASARHVRVYRDRIAGYAASLELAGPAVQAPERRPTEVGQAAFWLTLDAINFGSGWFPTLRKQPGVSGYYTIAGGLRERFAAAGPWSAAELAAIERDELGAVLDQDPAHELIGLFCTSLRDLGRRLLDAYDGEFTGPVRAADGSAVALVEILAGWDCFSDVARIDGLELPFLKRAQIAAADLHRCGAARFTDIERLTMFADNLVPHVLRLDGILEFEPALVARIEAGELLAHGSRAEVEIRGCALHAVELIVVARAATGAQVTAAAVDQLLWQRGQGASYKARPRHRCRCTAY